MTTIDPITGTVVSLFNPRLDIWIQHFDLEKARIIGRTSVGRATITLLRLNDRRRVIQRTLLIEAGRYPP